MAGRGASHLDGCNGGKLKLQDNGKAVTIEAIEDDQQANDADYTTIIDLNSMANMAPPAAEEEMGTASAFTLLPHGFKDMAECAAYNDYGTRLAIGSADGKVKVFDKVEDMDPKTDGKYELCDTWAAHNAEVFQVSCSSKLRRAIKP